MLKSRSAVYLLVISAVLLSACAPTGTITPPTASKSAGIMLSTRAATATSTATIAQDASTASELNTSYDNAVSIELQLLLGTLKLQGTDLAVTAEQASTLLPLWNNFKTISQSMTPTQKQANATPQPPSSNSKTQAQLTALVEQIQAVMTTDQIKAIAALKITRETALTIMQEQGITLGGPPSGSGNSTGSSNPPPQDTPPAGGPGNMGGTGAPPNGQLPADGQQPGNGQMPAAPAGGGMVPPELISVLIQLLEKTSSN